DAQPAGEVVVAGARLTDQLPALCLAERPDGSRRRYPCERLDGLGHRVTGELVVTAPTVIGGDEEPAFDQPAEMSARGPARHPGPRRQLARAQRPVGHSRPRP